MYTMSTGEKADSGTTTDGSTNGQNGADATSNGAQPRHTITREQRSAAAKRGWITRKKRKP